MSYEAPQFDDSPESSEPLLPPDEDMPQVDMLIGENSYRLTWHNTLLRTFSVGEGVFDYLLHDESEESTIYLFFSQLEDGPEFKEFLEENGYPNRRDPMLDESTISLYARMLSSDIEQSRKESFPD